MIIRVVALLLVLARPAWAETFVLVHGAFVGGWYWDEIGAGLEGRGHQVIAPDLTGHGRRAGEAGPEVALADHVADVVAAVDRAGGPVILVAHSYGGRPLTGAWDQRRESVKAVIYLEAVAPYGTGALALPTEVRQLAALEAQDPAAVARGMLPVPEYVKARYAGRGLADQSLAALFAELPLVNGPLPETPGAYVLGTKSRAGIFRQYAHRLGEERGWTTYQIEAGHDLAFDAPGTLIDLLEHLARELASE